MRLIFLLVAFVLAAAILAACGTPGIPQPAPATPAPVEAPPTAAPEPAAGADYAGAYAATLPAADTPGRQVTAVLAADGTVQITADYMNGQPPIVETGTWAPAADGGIVITLTAQDGQAYFTPQAIRAGLDDATGELVMTTGDGVEVRLAKAPAGAPTVTAPAAAAGEAAPVAGFTLPGVYTTTLPAADTPGRNVTATLAEDGGLAVTSDFLNGQPPVVETGTWEETADGEVTLTLSGHDGQPYDQPYVYQAMLDPATGDLVIGGGDEPVVRLVRVEGVPSAAASAAVTATVTTTAAVTATATMTTTQVSESLENTYFAFLPAASGGGTRLVALRLDEGGAAQLSTEFANDQPPIVETGTWVDNGDETLTVTLTGRPDRAYDKPVIITFQRDGDYVVSVGAEELYGSEGLRLRQAEAVARDAGAALFTIDLAAGFPLDPTFLSVNAGGEIDVSGLGGKCTGWISRQPVVTVYWTGQADAVKAFYVSDSDPTLVVVTPDGRALCNDNANPQLLDPVIAIDDPITGTYKIWVGSADPRQLIPGVLVLTTKPEVNLGTFDLGALIKRPLLPEALPEPPTDPTTAAITKTVDAPMAKVAVPEVGPDSAPVTATVTAEGTFPAFTVAALKDLGCAGLLPATPSFVFRWSGQADVLRVFFEGDADSTLVVLGAKGNVLACNDDALAGETIHPLVDIENPPEGLYGVFVGRLDPAAPVTGRLTVVPSTDLQPAPAKPKQ